MYMMLVTKNGQVSYMVKNDFREFFDRPFKECRKQKFQLMFGVPKAEMSSNTHDTYQTLNLNKKISDQNRLGIEQLK